MKTIKDLSKKVKLGASVALATTGLSTCHNNGAVDPAPPPLTCDGEGIANGAVISASGVFYDSAPDRLIVSLYTNYLAAFGKGLTVTATGITFLAIGEDKGTVAAEFSVPPGVTSGTFTLKGKFVDAGGASTECAFERTFSVTLSGKSATIAERATRLPLEIRHAANIGVVREANKELVLEAVTPHAGPKQIEWTVTGGVMTRDGERLVWRLPDEPGLYQAELVVRFGADGSDGLAFNTLAFEVV